MACSHISNVILEEEDEDDENEIEDEKLESKLFIRHQHTQAPTRQNFSATRHYSTPSRTYIPYERRDSGAVFSHKVSTQSTPINLTTDDDTYASDDDSEHDFAISRISDAAYDKMLKIAILSEKQSRFGETTKLLSRTSMTEYSTVRITLSKQEEFELLKEELESLTHMRHNNLARFYGYHVSNNLTVTLFRTFVPSGTVADKIKQGPLAEDHAIRYYGQILEALNYLHEENMIHGNIKCANLLLTISNEIQIADPAISCIAEPDSHLRRSLFYAAPEMLQDQNSMHKTTEVTDIWASGCVLVAMVTRFPPHQDTFILTHSVIELHDKLVKANTVGPSLQYTAEALIPNCGEKLAEILNSVFIKNGGLRPSALQLKQKFFESPTRQVSESFGQRKQTVLQHNDLYDDEPVNTYPELFYADPGAISEEGDNGTNSQEGSCLHWFAYVLSRLIYFVQFGCRTIAMFILAALSLALVAGTVILAIMLFYKGISIVCGCNLNEGFIVLIALILLPVLILLFTLCCNNTMEKYKDSKNDSSFVFTRPQDDVILCGVIVIDGKDQRKPSVRRKLATTNEESGCAENMPKTAFSRGVARIA